MLLLRFALLALLVLFMGFECFGGSMVSFNMVKGVSSLLPHLPLLPPPVLLLHLLMLHVQAGVNHH